MTLEIKAEVTSGIGALRSRVHREAAAVLVGAQRAVRRQGEETKIEARKVVAAGLRQHGRRRVANTIRSNFYEDTPAALVHSTWGYFEGGQFYDILGAHTHGAVILPKRGKYLFVPFAPQFRRAFRRAVGGERIELVPIKNGLLVVLLSGRGRGVRTGQPIGELVRRVTLRKRLDFREVETRAGRGLAEKLVVEMGRAERSAAAAPRSSGGRA